MLIKRIAAAVMCTAVMSAVLTSCGKEIKLEESSKASNGSSSASSPPRQALEATRADTHGCNSDPACRRTASQTL